MSAIENRRPLGRDSKRIHTISDCPCHSSRLTNTPVSACAAAKKLPPPGWTKPQEAVDSVFTPTGRDLGSSMISSLWFSLTSTHSPLDLGAIHEIGAPIHVYPLYENGFRAHRGQSLKANNEESAELYAEFSAVAEKQPYSWNSGKRDSKEVIGTVGKKNRMICFPCKFSFPQLLILVAPEGQGAQILKYVPKALRWIQRENPVPNLTTDRPPFNECLQHGKPSRHLHPHQHHHSQRPWHPAIKMDLPPRRCRHLRTRLFLG